MTSPTPQPTASDVFAVILAGGSGTRFWPKSRRLNPKQLCRIGSDDKTMLEVTLTRLDGFVPPDRRLIVTHESQVPATKAIVGDQCATILAEPEAKNTAAALALAALHIERTAGKDAIMISLHADHVIKDVAAFRHALTTAIAAARKEALVLLALKPTYPETGYGYIEQGPALDAPQGAFKVASFREKPDRANAEHFVATGRFYWNAGLFVWRVDTLLAELSKTLAPSVATLRAAMADDPQGFLATPAATLAKAYATLPKISIDHAMLEVSQRVVAVPAAIGWQDVGSWDAVARIKALDANGNVTFGKTCLIDSTNMTVDSDGPFVAVVGADNLVVVAAKGAILVCPKDRSQDVKRVVEWLEKNGEHQLL